MKNNTPDNQLLDNKRATQLLSAFTAGEQQLVEDLCSFLRFQSISTDPSYKQHVESCATWLVDYIDKIGLDVELWRNPAERGGGHPVVFASWMGAGPDKPTVLIYNHYDVQPVDPLELWQSPPFEPVIRDGEIYARGANDNKGQCIYVLAALRHLLAETGALPVNVKLCIEGEEEMGSGSISKLLAEKSSKLAADYLIVADLGLHSLDKPAVTLGCRGGVVFTVELRGSAVDLHSGTFGGVVYNPNHALVEMLAKLRDANGRVTVPGFYDDVRELTAEEREEIDFTFDPREVEHTVGAKTVGGEKNFSPLESAWVRPTLEINGLGGGYSGAGFKTVIPAVAIAKVSCRLVPNQDPAKISRALIDYLHSLTPEGIEISVKGEEHGPPLRASSKSQAVLATAQAYSEVLGKPAARILCGGSIPIASDLAKAAGAQAVLMGYGLPGDNLHAPNEHFGVARLSLGAATIARTLEILGGAESS